jgi:CheY-like chemotaxis protein
VKAEDATSAKSQFLNMMSHEIRTPLNGIIGLTHHLLAENPRADQKESLNLLKFSGENLLTIINDILDFGKIEANKIVLEKTDFDLRQDLRNVIKLMQMRTTGKPVSVRLEYDPKLDDYFNADPVRLGQVVNNLMSNAIKFTEAGFVQLSVKKVDQKGEDVMVEFAVEDSGIGIPADKLNSIFDSFSQASDDTTRKFGGTGLGLTITKQLLILMGSEIHVESAVGKGTRFNFVITLKIGSPPVEKALAKNGSDDHAIGKGMKALLAEDDMVNQIVASNFLKRWGLEVVVARDGKEAVKKIREKGFAIVFMDINMPELNGYEAVRLIRSIDDPYFKDVPILALTADAIGDIKERVLAAGMNGIMNKPFDPDELKSVIKRFAMTTPTDSISQVVEQYTNGDPGFKKEFVTLLIRNVAELQQGFKESKKRRDPQLFKDIVHKCATTLKMINEQKLTDTIQKTKTILEATADFSQIPPDVEQSLAVQTQHVIEKLERIGGEIGA